MICTLWIYCCMIVAGVYIRGVIKNILYNCPERNCGYSLGGEWYRFTVFSCTHMKVTVYFFGRPYYIVECFVILSYFGSILTLFCRWLICQMPQLSNSSNFFPDFSSSPSLPWSQEAYLTHEEATPSNSLLMRQLLRKHLDRARCTSCKPHIGSGDRGPQPFADPDSLFLGMSRCSACNYAKFISWTSQSSFLCKATCSTYTLARSNAARYSRSTQAAQTWTQKLR